jgi:uncharacterized membrane protein SpoIIM required for sporulation
MNVDAFLNKRRPSWEELEALLGAARRRPEKLGPARVLLLGRRYRGAAADLALARRSFPGDPTVAYLEGLVDRARHVVYDAPTRRGSLWRFITRDYWRLVVERRLALLFAALLLFAPAFLSGAWAWSDPGSASGLVPGAYRSVTEPRPHGSKDELSSPQRAEISSRIFTNNIEVTFLAFAGGMLLGLGTAALLVLNGVLLGTVAGLAIRAGNGRVFFELVVAHGVLELSCITVAGAAGLRLGWSIVDPGLRTRMTSLGAEARRAVAIVLGTMPWLVVAGLIEGFVTGSGISLEAVLAVGLGLGLAYWTLVVWRGRAPVTGGPVTSLADTT